MLTPVKSERYISVKSDGRFHEKVSAETEGAVYREYELKDGTNGGKWELLYKEISGVQITNVRFEDSDFGENILITLADESGEVVWAESTGSNFGTDLMKKLPGLDLSKKVSFKPYAFTDENGKDKRGVTVFQSDKVMDFFTKLKGADGVLEKGEWIKLHGFPEWPKEASEMSKDDWKMYFLQVKMFLTDYTKKNIVPKFAEVSQSKNEIDYPGDAPNPEDIPF